MDCRSTPCRPVAVESFAGVANPFELRALEEGEHVVDLGSGAGLRQLPGGPIAVGAGVADGHVVGVDMTTEMLTQGHRRRLEAMGADNVEFREGYIEDLPVEDGWADVVISNGVINLCPRQAPECSDEIWRVLQGPAASCSSPTSPTATRCPRRPGATSICGLVESPVACRVQDGRICWRSWASSGSRSVRRSTPSGVPAARRTPGRSRSADTPSWPASRPSGRADGRRTSPGPRGRAGRRVRR